MHARYRNLRKKDTRNFACDKSTLENQTFSHERDSFHTETLRFDHICKEIGIREEKSGRLIQEGLHFILHFILSQSRSNFGES